MLAAQAHATTVLDACLLPELATELTLQGLHQQGGNAAVFFTDAAVPLLLAGIDLATDADGRPVVERPMRTASDVASLRPIDPATLQPIRDAVAAAVGELGSVPLIALAGAPFTLASMLIDGGAWSDRHRARAMMYADPQSWATLLNWCADVSGEFLAAQVVAGASVAMLVDPNAGALSERDYVRRVAPHSKRALSALRGLDVSKVHVGVGGGELLHAMHAIGADAVGVDWRIPLDEASRRLGGAVPLHGNLDPALLGAPWKTVESHVRDVVDRGRDAPAHVVTLGDDVLPLVDDAVLARIVELVHSL